MTTYKRSMKQPIQADTRTEQQIALASIGMRIRKAVSEGYNVPANTYQGFNQANTFTYNNIDYQDTNPQTNPSTRRMPLPNHIEQPPALTNQFSTFQSNVSEWGPQPTDNLVTLENEISSSKRKYRDDNDDSLTGSLEFKEPLRFDEEF